jgi:uncharacterized membrane protein
MSARGWIGWTALTLAIAAAVHIFSIHFLPHIVMSRAMAQMGAVNTIHHGARATAEIHGVVRPSPDLLYSVCPYDVSKEPVLIVADVPAGTYWSVSMFDADTNNFFVLNDRRVSGTIMLTLLSADTPPDRMHPTRAPENSKSSNVRTVEAPTARGLILFRTLVNDEKNLAAIEGARRRAFCAPLSALPRF